jgi:hypothetical protein
VGLTLVRRKERGRAQPPVDMLGAPSRVYRVHPVAAAISDSIKLIRVTEKHQ